MSVQCMDGNIVDGITWYFSPFQYGEAEKVSHNHTLFIPAMHYYNSGQYYCVQEAGRIYIVRPIRTYVLVDDENRDEMKEIHKEIKSVITKKIEILIKGKKFYTKPFNHVLCNVRPIFKKQIKGITILIFQHTKLDAAVVVTKTI